MNKNKIRTGEIVTDCTDRKWKIGKRIGLGGFADIYEVSDDITKTVGNDAKYVLKIEPSENGPLFVELHCYHRIGQEDQIKQWMKERKLAHLGMPRLVGSGCHYYRGNKYRFIVLDKFGKDVQTLVEESNGKIAAQAALSLAIKTIDALEYIHHHGFIHGDIKGSNVLLHEKYGDKKAHLLDYGLALKYLQGDGSHREYKEDLRFAHGGTIQYASRDAHIGAYSRKSDLESLGYNLVHWCSGSLPWENCLDGGEEEEEVKEEIKEKKIKYMMNIENFMNVCFKHRSEGLARVIAQYLACVDNLRFDAEPNYSRLKNVLMAGLHLMDSPKLKENATTKRAIKRKSNEENANAPPPKLKLGEARKPLSSCRNLRSSPDYVDNFEFDLDELVKMERSIYKERAEKESMDISVENPTSYMKQAMVELRRASDKKIPPLTQEGEPLENFDSIPTSFMEDVLRKKKKQKPNKVEDCLSTPVKGATRNKKGSKSLPNQKPETSQKRRSKAVSCKLSCCQPPGKETVDSPVPIKAVKRGRAKPRPAQLNADNYNSLASQLESRLDSLQRRTRRMSAQPSVSSRAQSPLASGPLANGFPSEFNTESGPLTRRRRRMSTHPSPIHSRPQSPQASGSFDYEFPLEVKPFTRRRRHMSTHPSPIHSRPQSPQATGSLDNVTPLESGPLTRRRRRMSTQPTPVHSRPQSPQAFGSADYEFPLETKPLTRRRRRMSAHPSPVHSRPQSPQALGSLDSEVSLGFRPLTRRRRHASALPSPIPSRPQSPRLLDDMSLESSTETRCSRRRTRHSSAHASPIASNVNSRPHTPVKSNSLISSTKFKPLQRRKRHQSARLSTNSMPISPLFRSPVVTLEMLDLFTEYGNRKLEPVTASRPTSPASTDNRPARRTRHASAQSTPTPSTSRSSSATPPLEEWILTSPRRKQRDSESLACHLLSTPPSNFGLVYL